MKRSYLLSLVVFFVFLIAVPPSWGQQSVLLKVGGDFLIKSIESHKGIYDVTFSSVDGGKDLILHTDHVHAGLQKGSKMRLSAEVMGEGPVLEVNQVMVFLPIPEGVKPVWMLSKNFKGGDAPSRYLEMHDPQSDYILF
ncbi:MAG: hypothetical protein WCI18_13040 [Pseudomonadota bacterium]